MGYQAKKSANTQTPPFHTPVNGGTERGKGEGKGGGIEFTREPSVIERLAYKDTFVSVVNIFVNDAAATVEVIIAESINKETRY